MMKYKVFYLDKDCCMRHFYVKGFGVKSIMEKVLYDVYDTFEYEEIWDKANRYHNFVNGVYETLSQNTYSTKLIGIVNTENNWLEFGDFNPDDYDE